MTTPSPLVRESSSWRGRLPAWRALAFTLSSGFASACCGFAACPPASQVPSADAAIEQLRAQHACSRAIRGEAKLDYFDEHGRVRVDTLFLAQHPQSVRMDLISPLGGTLATLTSDDERFALLDQREKAFYVGPAAQCNVERFLRVPVPPAVLVQLMAGGAPVLVHEPEQATLRWSGGRYVIEIASKHEATEVIELVPHEADWNKHWTQQRLRVVSVSVSQQGTPLYQAELKEHRVAQTAKPRVDPLGIDDPIAPSGPQCQAEIPRRVRFVVPLSERDVVFEHRDVEHNPPLIPGSFAQEMPAGVRVRDAACE